MGKLLYNDNMFNRIMSKVFDLILLGVLTFFGSLPIITAGAALQSAYKIMLEMADGVEGPVTKSFFRYYKNILKKDFKDCIKGWSIILAFYVVLTLDLFLLTKSSIESRSFLYGVTIVMLVSVIAVSDWFLTLKATFNEGSKENFKNAIGFFFVYLLQSLLGGGYTILVFYILTRFPYLVGVALVFGNMLLKYPTLLLYKKQIDKYMLDKGIEPESVEVFEPEKVEETEESVETKHKPNMRYATVIGAVVLVGGVIIYQIFFADHRDCYKVAVVNAYVKESDVDISDRLSSTLVQDTSKEKVYFDTQYQLEYPGVKNMMADTSFQEKLLLNIGVGEVDVAVLPKKFVEFCNKSEYIFRDVSTVLDEDTLKGLEDDLIYTKDEDGRTYPCGVTVADTEFLNKEDFTFIEGSAGDDAIIVFPINADNDNFCNEFVEELVRGY